MQRKMYYWFHHKPGARVPGRVGAGAVCNYTNKFLHAQDVSTWQAMIEIGRPCFLLIIDGSLDDAIQLLSTFFSQVEQYLHHV